MHATRSSAGHLGVNRSADVAWKDLAIFESSDLARRLYKRRHHLDLSAGKAREITTALAQGRQYFAELSSVGQLARPLVLFYGVVALSRAAILFFNPSANEANLNPAHGLTVLSWQQTLAGGIKKIPELRLKAANGTFIELADATQVVDRVSVYVAPYPATKMVRTANLASMSVGWVFSLRDLLGRVPDLHNMYEETFEEHAPCRRVFVFLLAGAGPYQTAIDVLATRLGLPTEVQARQDLGLQPDEQLIKRSNHNFLGASSTGASNSRGNPCRTCWTACGILRMTLAATCSWYQQFLRGHGYPDCCCSMRSVSRWECSRVTTQAAGWVCWQAEPATSHIPCWPRHHESLRICFHNC